MSHQQIHADARAALDASVEMLPDAVRERLATARARALDAQVVVGRLRSPTRWAPAFALAATLMIAVGLWRQTVLPPLPAIDSPLEARAAQELELLDELEFVAWMELQEQAQTPGALDAIDA